MTQYRQLTCFVDCLYPDPAKISHEGLSEKLKTTIIACTHTFQHFEFGKDICWMHEGVTPPSSLHLFSYALVYSTNSLVYDRPG